MIRIKSLHVSALSLVAAFAIAGCGSSGNDKPSASVTVNPLQDTNITVGNATLTIPANAFATAKTITMREAEPLHGGVARYEIDQHNMALDDATKPARFSIRVDDSSARVKLVDDDHGALQVEPEDRNHGAYKTTMTHLGEMEVELEHNSCTPACGAGFECEEEHGTFSCKAHTEHPEARTCATVCPTGQECDDGACKLHSEVEPHDVGTTCVPSCATGYFCHDGICTTNP